MQRPRLKNRTKFAIFSVFNLTWYAVAVLALSYFDKIVPDTLTAAWFAAWTVELALLFGIKIKDKGDNDGI